MLEHRSKTLHADGAEGGNPEEEAAAFGWSAPASPQPPPGSVHIVTNAVKVEQLAGEIESMRAELVQKVLEGLRGDAYLVALQADGGRWD